MKKIRIFRLISSYAIAGFIAVFSSPFTYSDELSDSLVQKHERETNQQRKALRTIESDLGLLYKNIAQMEENIASESKAITRLDVESQQLKARLQDKSEEIKDILKLAYKQNNQPLLKLLLSGERPEDLSRHLYYFSVLTSNQHDVLNHWLEDQTRLSETIKQHELAIARLEKDQNALQKDRKSLESQKKKRQQVIANLQTDSQSVTQKMNEKQQERERLTALIDQIQAEIERMALEFPETEAISEVKGRLGWPVSGRLQNQYGKKIDDSGLRWQGLLIAAAEGAPVKAVHGGRVVFADFFKSNGLLVIIDHGKGIWTLYGRNRALLTKVGAWVEAGDVIAEVGQSGGYSESGLYFEVRQNGMPINPATWLSKR
ncbi:MAG: peptidoglycan DD-metalloendopeptidase family protein [Reinekea sp.]